MNIGPARALAALAASSVLVLGSAAASSAATWSHVDLTHDVQTSTDGGTTSTTDPTNSSTDVTRVYAANNRANVVVRLVTRTALPGKNYFVDVEVKTATAHYTAVRFNFNGTSGHVLTRGTTKVACKGMVFDIDRTTRIDQVTVPWTCLGKPSWIRVGAGVVTMDATDSNEWADDGLSSKVGGDLVPSPRIARG